MNSIGIDIGGMSAKLGLVCGHTILSQQNLPTGAELSYEAFLEQLTEGIEALRLEAKTLADPEGEVEKIGISSCGLIDSRTGMVVYSNNIPWEKKHLGAELEERTGLSVRMANDAKCAALAEAVFGAGKDYERVCMITLGTGVGGAFLTGKQLSRGNLYQDADGILGHITVERNGRACTCGRKGCLEAYSSATAIMKTYQEHTGHAYSAKVIFDRVRAGEAAAQKTLEEFQYYLAEGLVSLVNVLRPEIIIIGGGVSKSAELFLPYVKETINHQAYGGSVLPVEVVPAMFGNEAGMIGASLL